MNEIEKLYELAGIEYTTKCSGLIHCEDCEHSEEINCYNKYYSPFTPEKQLELVKWLFDSIYLLCLGPLQHSENFENSLAELVNCLWQDLTEEEKQQVKEILE